MTWCPHCAQYTETHRDFFTCNLCCVDCGKVVSQDIYSEDATFVKDAAGAARLEGNRVTFLSAFTESHRRTLNKGNDVIDQLIGKYGITNVGNATKFYEWAVDHGFTRGRETRKVAAACLYLACREMEKPFMLVEFSSELGVSVYELGTVYLQLCKLMNLQQHSFVRRPVDPSLFMHRYTSELMKDKDNKKVLDTALQLVVSMKRDWIQTGRKPSGICAAAIYVSLALHGYEFSKTDVVRAVHICEATLTKRLTEFENTKAGNLTIDEFTQNVIEFEKGMQSCKQPPIDVKMPGMTELVCQHKNNAVQSGFGLCKECYLEFSGGLDGSDPPAFQRAQVERFSKGIQGSMKGSENIGTSTKVECVAHNSGKLDNSVDAYEGLKETPAEESDTLYDTDESDTLDDIDDSEIVCYLLDEEESRLKKIIWELMNGVNMQEQAAREAAAQVVASKKESNKRKRELEAKNVKPAQTAAEAAGQYFMKRFSSKINYDVLTRLFADEDTSHEHRVDDGGNAKGKEIVSED